MARKEASVKCAMLVQQMRPELWELFSVDVQSIVKHASKESDPDQLRKYAEQLGGVLFNHLQSAELDVNSAHAIIQDKDVAQVWDDDAGVMVEQPVFPHIHFVVTLHEGVPLTRIAQAMKMPPQQVDKLGRGGRPDNWMAYLIHAKDADKYQYPVRQVATIEGRNYAEIYAERREDWRRGGVVKTARAATDEEAVEDLFAKCLSGEVWLSDILDDDKMTEIYARNESKILGALRIYGQRRMRRAVKALQDKEFRTQVLFFTGMPEAGKSHAAKHFVNTLADAARLSGERWGVYKGASANVLDDYNGEEIIFLDDARGSGMEAPEWLHLLDADNSSPAKARFKNIMELAPRLIVITAFVSPVDFFFFTKGRAGVNEAMDQFLRRVSGVVHVVPTETFPDGVDPRLYVAEIIGRRDEFSVRVETSRSLNDMSGEIVRLKHGPIARGETHSLDDAITFLLAFFRKYSPDVEWHESLLLEPSFKMLDASVVEEQTRQIEQVGRDELFDQYQKITNYDLRRDPRFADTSADQLEHLIRSVREVALYELNRDLRQAKPESNYDLNHGAFPVEWPYQD